jgi:hypothetical protein
MLPATRFQTAIPEPQSYFLLVLWVCLGWLELQWSCSTPNARHKLGCLATNTILNLSPTSQAQFSLLPCTTSSPAWAPSAADCAAHAASPSPASGATSSSDGGSTLASAARDLRKVEEAAADLLGSATPRSPPRRMWRPRWRRSRRPTRCRSIADAPVGRRN